MQKEHSNLCGTLTLLFILFFFGATCPDSGDWRQAAFGTSFVCASVPMGSSCLGSSKFTLHLQETLERARGVISAEAC